MPMYQYEISINGQVQYTCFSESQCKFYTFYLDFAGIDYEIVKTYLEY